MLDEHGELVTVTMGSYGIGVSRAVAAIAEQVFRSDNVLPVVTIGACSRE